MDLFWQQVDYGGVGCWEWQGACFDSGYARVGNLRASRVVDFAINGDLPPRLFVLHRCDNRRCVRPSHLYRGTHEQNMLDMRERQRQTRGTACHSSKLSEADVLAIRVDYATAHVRQVDLAVKYSVSQAMVSSIVRREKWAWL